MLPDDPALRRRMLVAMLLVVLLPFVFLYAFVAAVNRILFPLFEGMGYGPFGTVSLSPTLAAVIVFGGLAAQAVFGSRTVLSSIGARRASPEEYPAVFDAVTRLAHQANAEPPDVAIARNQAPNAAAVRGPDGGTIIVTSGLLETLSPAERDAVLAHELTHLKNQDATLMTIAWLLPTLTYYLALGTATVLKYLYRGIGRSGTRGGGRGAAKALLVLTVTALVTMAISAIFWMASVLVHRVLSRYREYAADRGAVGLTGDPAALASALRTLDDSMPDVPDRDLRRLDGGTEALYVAPLEGRAFTEAELVSTDIFPETHPPTENRIEALQEMAHDIV